MNQVARVVTELGKGRTLTSDQARTRYGIVNLRARITDVRDLGYDVVAETKKSRDGTRVTKYSFAS